MGMASFVVTCPCCAGRLTIDPEVQAVIAHEAPPRQRSGLDLGGALDSRFKDQMKAEATRSRVLDRMFQEGLKKAKDDPDPPLNPMERD
jgi:hypothetical protein